MCVPRSVLRGAQLEQHAARAFWMHKGNAALVGPRRGLLRDARACCGHGGGVGVDVWGAQGDVVDAAAALVEELAHFAVVLAAGQGRHQLDARVAHGQKRNADPTLGQLLDVLAHKAELGLPKGQALVEVFRGDRDVVEGFNVGHDAVVAVR